MCNIAGYNGNKNAAPILLEMLRRQQGYDGGACTGIATIYNGRIYYRKIAGDVDALMKYTDALSLPGTIGIAHTRPSGNALTYVHAHPFITENEDMAYVTNGTSREPSYNEKAKEICTMLEKEGYNFRDRTFTPAFETVLSDGSNVSCVEVRMNYVDYFIKKGMSVTAAMAKVLSYLYTDNVSVLLNLAHPDSIFALRTTRPMALLEGDGEMYMATTRYAFPDDVKGKVSQLPLRYACEITKDSLIVSDDALSGCEEVCEVTDEVFEKAYERIEKMLLGKKDAPLFFDDLELAVFHKMKDIWPEQHTLMQDGRLVYDVLYKLDMEGRLKRTIRMVSGDGFIKERIYMWLES